MYQLPTVNWFNWTSLYWGQCWQINVITRFRVGGRQEPDAINSRRYGSLFFFLNNSVRWPQSKRWQITTPSVFTENVHVSSTSDKTNTQYFWPAHLTIKNYPLLDLQNNLSKSVVVAQLTKQKTRWRPRRKRTYCSSEDLAFAAVTRVFLSNYDQLPKKRNFPQCHVRHVWLVLCFVYDSVVCCPHVTYQPHRFPKGVKLAAKSVKAGENMIDRRYYIDVNPWQRNFLPTTAD